MNNLAIPKGTDLNTLNVHQCKGTFRRQQISLDDLEFTDEVLDSLPPIFLDYIEFTKPLSDVPIEFLFTPFLANLGALIGNRRHVAVGGIKLFPVIWTVLFAGSSTQRKSTALSLARRPFKRLEDKWTKQFFDAYEHWKTTTNKKPPSDPEPSRRTLYMSDNFSDVTFWEVLGGNPGCISNASEFSTLWLELTRSRNMMQDLVLSIFDSDDSVRRSTKNSGHFELNNPVWNIAGATTIDRFRGVLSTTERSSGFLQRILPIYSVNTSREFKALTDLPSPNKAFQDSLSILVESLEDLSYRSVSLTPEAKEIFSAWSHKQHNLGLELEESIPDIGGYLSRLDAYGLKIALIFQTLEDPESDIEDYIIEASIVVCEWLLNHIIFMLDRNYIFNRSYADRIKVRSLLEKHGGKLSRTDLMNLSHLDKDQLDKAVSNEIEAGYIRKISTPTGARPLIEYESIQGAENVES